MSTVIYYLSSGVSLSRLKAIVVKLLVGPCLLNTLKFCIQFSLFGNISSLTFSNMYHTIVCV